MKDIYGTSGHPRLGQAEINPLRVTRIHHPRELPESVIIERYWLRMPQGTYGAKSASYPGTFHSSIRRNLLPQFQPSLAHILAADCSSIELLKAPEDSEIPLLMQYSTLCINIRTESRSGMFSYLRAGILKTPLSSNISFSIMQQESRPPMDMSSCEWSRDL